MSDRGKRLNEHDIRRLETVTRPTQSLSPCAHGRRCVRCAISFESVTGDRQGFARMHYG